MRLTRLRGQCDPKPTCPTLYLTDQGSLIVQGWIVPGERGSLIDEARVEVPLSLLWLPSADVPQSPAIELTGRDTAIVRGKPVTEPEALDQLTLPEGETAVEVSLSLLPGVVPSAR
jgi:hypothetical protein